MRSPMSDQSGCICKRYMLLYLQPILGVINLSVYLENSNSPVQALP